MVLTGQRSCISWILWIPRTGESTESYSRFWTTWTKGNIQFVEDTPWVTAPTWMSSLLETMLLGMIWTSWKRKNSPLRSIWRRQRGFWGVPRCLSLLRGRSWSRPVLYILYLITCSKHGWLEVPTAVGQGGGENGGASLPSLSMSVPLALEDWNAEPTRLPPALLATRWASHFPKHHKRVNKRIRYHHSCICGGWISWSFQRSTLILTPLRVLSFHPPVSTFSTDSVTPSFFLLLSTLDAIPTIRSVLGFLVLNSWNIFLDSQGCFSQILLTVNFWRW